MVKRGIVGGGGGPFASHAFRPPVLDYVQSDLVLSMDVGLSYFFEVFLSSDSRNHTAKKKDAADTSKLGLSALLRPSTACPLLLKMP